MGWGSKKKESFAAQPARSPMAVEADEPMPVAEARDAVDDDEPVAAATVGSAVGSATIGATLRLQGELTGHEDVTIDGTVDGRVEVLDHTITIGASASVKASIRARCVVIEGQVVGDVTADDKVEVTATGSLVGDIRAARVVLAENARFKGSVDMGWSESESKAKPEPRPKPEPKWKSEPMSEPKAEPKWKSEPMSAPEGLTLEPDELTEASPRRPRKEERPAPPPPSPKAGAPAANSKLSSLDWGDTTSPSPGTSTKD